MDPEAIKKRIIDKAKKDKQVEIASKKKFEDDMQMLRNLEVGGFKEAFELFSEILKDLTLKKGVDVRLTDQTLTIYHSGFGGGSDTYEFFFNSALGNLCVKHTNKFGVYFDDFGATSYNFDDPSENQIVEETAFDNLEEFKSSFEKTIQEYVKV